MSLLSTYINPNLSGLATTESVAAAQAAIDALVDADKQAVIDAVAGMSSANLATLMSAIAAIPSADLQPVLDAIGELSSPATGLPSGAVIKLQGNHPAPAGFTFLDTQVTNATEQGCAYYDAVAESARAVDAGLTVIDQIGDGNALVGYAHSVGEPIYDPNLGDISSFSFGYDLSAEYSSAAVVSALFVPGEPSCLYLVLKAVKTADGQTKLVVLRMLPDGDMGQFVINTQGELDLVAEFAFLFDDWGSETQCSFVADSTAGEGAQVCAMRLGSLTFAKWLLWDLGETLNLRVTNGDTSVSQAALNANRSSVRRVLAYHPAEKAFICVMDSDSAMRSRVGVYYDAENDVMCAQAVSMVVGAPEKSAVVRPLVGEDQPTAFLAYTKLGFFEIRHSTPTGGVVDVFVRQTSARHPHDSFGGVVNGLGYGADNYVLMYFNGTPNRALNCDYTALKAGFERKAVKD
jgi:hypothetical protein